MSPRDVALTNVGAGPDPFSFADLDADFAVVLLHRDYYCRNCRQQIQRVRRRYDEFRARNAEVVSVLPEDEATAIEWASQYGLAFPVVADPEATLGERFDQPRRFGLLGRLHDVVGRLPATVVLDLRGPDPDRLYVHRGSSPADRPSVDDLLALLDRAAASPRLDSEAGADGSAADAEADEDESETPDGAPGGVTIRTAMEDDVLAVMQVLQGALLDVALETVREAIDADDVLVAEDDDWIVGALVLDDAHVESVAVRRERRGNGVGSALVEAAAARTDGLTADFRSGVRGFWADLGFEIEEREERLWGERSE